MNTSFKILLGATALGLACQAPATLAAYAFASGDAALFITGSGYQLTDFEVTPSASVAMVGDALARAEGEVLRQADGLVVFGTASVDALFPSASAASANYSSTQPLLVQNTSGAANVLDFSFDWSVVVEAGADFVAPLESAQATVTVSLQQVANGVQTELFAQTALASIVDGALFDADVFTFSYTLMADELAVFLVGINATSEAATAVPLPASLPLLLPALGMLARRRRAKR
ncbi:MAG: hypothetical protein RLW62_18335 [Gammaproteobacteria bacterium]